MVRVNCGRMDTAPNGALFVSCLVRVNLPVYTLSVWPGVVAWSATVFGLREYSTLLVLVSALPATAFLFTVMSYLTTTAAPTGNLAFMATMSDAVVWSFVVGAKMMRNLPLSVVTL